MNDNLYAVMLDQELTAAKRAAEIHCENLHKHILNSNWTLAAESAHFATIVIQTIQNITHLEELRAKAEQSK